MSRTETLVRWAVFLGWLGYCEFQGGPRAVFYGFLGFGLLCVLWYTIIDTWHRLAGVLSHPQTTVDARSVTIYQDGAQARRGVPVTDDFAGMIEYRTHT